MIRDGRHRSAPQESLDYLMRLFESSPVAIVSLDARLRIVLFNRAAQRLTGYHFSEVAGRRVNKLIRGKNLRYIIQVLRKKRGFSGDGFITKVIGKGGGETPIRLVISPLGSPDGTLTGVLCIASDLSDVKRFQGKLLEAERLDALSEIAVSINHEINNPLCSILGNTQLILMDRDKLDPETVRKLKNIEREIARIERIARKLPRITRPVIKEYVGGRRMLDLDGSEALDGRSRRRR
jgi:PAS domain S-box-containing protein